MFKRSDLPKRRKRGVGIHRIIMSMIMIGILSLGVLQAVKGFSGIDPLQISPSSLSKNLLSSDGVYNSNGERISNFVYNFLTGLLSFNPSSLKELASHKVTPSSDKTGQPASGETQPSQHIPKPTPRPTLLFKFALVADSHVDIPDLQKAVGQINQINPDFVIGLGDYSDVGTIDELRNSKKQFDLFRMPYYLTPGDHDDWDSLNRGLKSSADFTSVFGLNYQSFTYRSVGFILVDDSNNYDGIDEAQRQWIVNTLQKFHQQNLKDIFVLTHIPLYHPSSDHVLGKADPDLVKQADYYINLFKQEEVTEVIAGDIHFFSQYTEPRTGLKMTTVGAVTDDRNLEEPRFATVDVFSDGSYTISDTPIK